MSEIVLPDRLPGKEAHLKLAPETRISSLTKEQTPPSTARESAVLVMLTPTKESSKNIINPINDWELLLIKRNTYHGVHSGQIAFPGGKCEIYDVDYKATACREAYEELKIDSTKIKIVGELSKLYVPPSNFTIYPILAINNGIEKYIPEPREVTEYLHIPLRHFNPEHAKRCRVQITPNSWVHAPGYIIDNHTIWGATAMIISELFQIIN